MITKLINKQKLKFEEYRNKYINIGLNIDRINKKECVEKINDIYIKILKRNKPRKVIFCQSPYQLWIMLSIYKLAFKEILFRLKNKKYDKNEVMNEVMNEVRNEVMNEVENEVMNEVSNEVENEVENEVMNEVSNEVENEVENEVWNEVENEVSNEVRNEVSNEVSNEVRNEVENEVERIKINRKYLMYFVYPYLYGNFDASYFSFYSFMKNILKIKFKKEELYNLYEWTLNVGFIYPLKNICFISEKPIEIYRNNKGKLHNDNKPALKYSDNFSLYRMNGVKVPKWLVEISKEKLDIKDILKIENVEVRAQGLRKIGIEKFQKELKEIDILNDYILYDCGHLIDNTYIPILKMKNPSILLLNHYEYISPECKTVQEAINWRYSGDKNKLWNPYEIT